MKSIALKCVDGARDAKRLLAAKGAEFEEIDIREHPERFEEMVERSGGRRTVPQIFIEGHHVGGFDDLEALDQQGELDPLLSPDSVD